MTGQWWKPEGGELPSSRPEPGERFLIELGPEFSEWAGLATDAAYMELRGHVREWLDGKRDHLVLPPGAKLIRGADLKAIEVGFSSRGNVALPVSASWTVAGGVEPESQNWAGVE